MTYLGEGDLAGARVVLKTALKKVEPTALVAYVATVNDLVWVEEQRELLLRLTPSAFDDDRANWALCPGWLKIDPNFDPLRKNPRLKTLVAAR